MFQIGISMFCLAAVLCLLVAIADSIALFSLASGLTFAIRGSGPHLLSYVLNSYFGGLSRVHVT